MTIESYANHDTNSKGKRASTKFGLVNSVFYNGKVFYLCGAGTGMDRHAKDNLRKGYALKDQVIVERDPEAAQRLVKYKQQHPHLEDLTILCGDMLDLIKSNQHLDIAHVDMDTATGLKDSCDQILEMGNMGIKTIFWTIASRRTDVKDLCKNLKEWAIRQSNGTYKFMPPKQKDLIPEILEQFFDGDYTVEAYPYTGLGSSSHGAGGSPMIMFVLNRNY